MQTYRVGLNVDAWCTRCKLVLAHTIEAMADDVIKRVECNTCRGKHMFKAQEPGMKKTVGINKNAVAPKSRSRTGEFLRLISNKDISKAFGYSFSQRFNNGDLIRHDRFGIGVVVEQRDANKIEILFESGPKILIHARP